jgi:site-specific DNA-cytosine methylase
MKFGDFFSGGGFMAVGAQAAGWDVRFGVNEEVGKPQMSERIAASYEQNLGAHLFHTRVEDVPMSELEAVDWFHASPPCQSFSIGSTVRVGVKNSDVTAALAVAKYITTYQPRYVTIENVRAYQHDLMAWGAIKDALKAGGYHITESLIDMADFGVASNRIRFFVIASKTPLPPLFGTHSTRQGQLSLFGGAQEGWVSWDEVLAPYFPHLKQVDLIRHYAQGLPKGETGGRSFALPASQVSNVGVREMQPIVKGRPWGTITAGDYRRPSSSPILFLTHEDRGAGAVSMKRSAVIDDSPFRGIVPDKGIFVRVSVEALSLLQSIPRAYQHNPHERTAVHMIGNGIPPLFAAKVGMYLARDWGGWSIEDHPQRATIERWWGGGGGYPDFRQLWQQKTPKV